MRLCAPLFWLCAACPYKVKHSISCCQLHHRSSAKRTEHSSKLILTIIADTNGKKRRRTDRERERQKNWNFCVCRIKYASTTNDDKKEEFPLCIVSMLVTYIAVYRLHVHIDRYNTACIPQTHTVSHSSTWIFNSGDCMSFVLDEQYRWNWFRSVFIVVYNSHLVPLAVRFGSKQLCHPCAISDISTESIDTIDQFVFDNEWFIRFFPHCFFFF